MRLVIQPDYKKSVVETRLGNMSIQEVYLQLAARSHRSFGSIEKEAGLVHPTGVNFRNSKSDSLKTFALLMDELGYDILIQKRK